MHQPPIIPPPGQRGTLTVRGVICSQAEPGANGAVVMHFDIGATGDELVLDLNNGHVEFAADRPELPEHFPPQRPGELWSAFDCEGKMIHFVVVNHVGSVCPKLVFMPLRHVFGWDGPANLRSADFALNAYTRLTRITEGLDLA